MRTLVAAEPLHRAGSARRIAPAEILHEIVQRGVLIPCQDRNQAEIDCDIQQQQAGDENSHIPRGESDADRPPEALKRI